MTFRYIRYDTNFAHCRRFT